MNAFRWNCLGIFVHRVTFQFYDFGYHDGQNRPLTKRTGIREYIDGLAQDYSNSITNEIHDVQYRPLTKRTGIREYIDGLVQDYSNSIANELHDGQNRPLAKQTGIREYIDGLVQDYSNSIANALELLQSYTRPLICFSKYIAEAYAVNKSWCR